MPEIDSVGDFLHILCTAATTLVWAFTKQEQVDELQSSVHVIVLTYSDIQKNPARRTNKSVCMKEFMWTDPHYFTL